MEQRLNSHEKLVKFDCINQTIIRPEGQFQLSSRAFEVLNCLSDHPDQLISKTELLNQIWPDVITVEAVLKNCISEIRKALNDNPRQPRFIQTIHRRGYRFIGGSYFLKLSCTSENQTISMSLDAQTCKSNLFGRKKDFSRLNQCWQKSSAGAHQQVVIKGGPGVGKTALAKSWLKHSVDSNKEILVLKSQCKSFTPQYPYMTVIDCVDQICNSRFSETAYELLNRCSPQLVKSLPVLAQHWSGNKDALVNLSESEILVFQIARFFESLSEKITLLWFIDDVHWADSKTLAALSYIQTRSNATRLMILMTCCNWAIQSRQRTSDLSYFESEIDQNAEQIKLSFLDKSATISLIKKDIQPSLINSDSENHIYKISSGHPLIAKAMVETLNQDRYQDGIPRLLRQRMQLELSKLNRDHYRLLQTASVIVVKEFSAAAISWLLSKSIIEIEDTCEELVLTTGWFKRAGIRTWPDGTTAQLYRFTHRVYRDYIYQTLSAAHRCELHYQHAKRLELAYSNQISAIIPNLIYHYQKSDYYDELVRINKLATQTDIDSKLNWVSTLKPQHHYSFSLANSPSSN